MSFIVQNVNFRCRSSISSNVSRLDPCRALILSPRCIQVGIQRPRREVLIAVFTVLAIPQLVIPHATLHLSRTSHLLHAS